MHRRINKRRRLVYGLGLIYYYDNSHFKIIKESSIFKIDKGMENRLLINALRRIKYGKDSNILIRDYIEYE